MHVPTPVRRITPSFRIHSAAPKPSAMAANKLPASTATPGAAALDDVAAAWLLEVLVEEPLALVVLGVPAAAATEDVAVVEARVVVLEGSEALAALQ